MDIFNYFIYKMSGPSTFNQSLICDNGYMDRSGSCFGICVDWLRYNMKHPDGNYIVDKYNHKHVTVLQFDIQDGGISVAHNMDSKNYYNRVNYFHEKSNLEYDKTDLSFLQNTPNSVVPDRSFVILNDKYSGHACAYNITNSPAGFKYVYFDPNFGETYSETYNTRNEVVSNLKQLIDSEITKYKVMSLGKYNFTDKTLLIKDGEEFTNYLTESWKKNKLEIENYGTHEDSLSYDEFPEDLFKHDYYNS